MSANPPRVALVTGAGRKRLGWHIAQDLATAGYSLAIHYRTAQVEARDTVDGLVAQGAEAMALQADLSDESAVRRLVESVLHRFGRIDVLVNTAATWSPQPLESITAADVRGYLEANTLGTFLTCQHAGLAMVKQSEGGSIINFGDWATVRPYRDYAAYFPSKGAIPTLTRTMAVELGTRNPAVRVNAILPGPVMIPDDVPAAEREAAIRATLVQREGSPHHIVLAVRYLLANDFVTGTCLTVDGGRSIFAGGL
jgi:pteridine reductase